MRSPCQCDQLHLHQQDFIAFLHLQDLFFISSPVRTSFFSSLARHSFTCRTYSSPARFIFLPSLLPCFLASLLPCFLVSLLPCFLASLLPCFLASLLPCYLASFLSSLAGFSASFIHLQDFFFTRWTFLHLYRIITGSHSVDSTLWLPVMILSHVRFIYVVPSYDVRIFKGMNNIET